VKNPVGEVFGILFIYFIFMKEHVHMSPDKILNSSTMEDIYKNKIVCFIDILGFGDMVSKEFPDDGMKIYSILTNISNSISSWSAQPISSDIDIVITQFSDSLIFSFLPTSHYFMTFHFFKELSVKMVELGIVFRGGITYGKIYHDEEFVFGPAFNEAYRLESKIAIVPRIIIDNLALELKNDDGKRINDYSGQFIFKVNESDYSYVDYIVDVNGYTTQKTYYERLRRLIIRGLESDDLRVREKYLWMKAEFNLAKETYEALELI
jgi:hypothetical protein